MPKHVRYTFEGGGIAVWRITETSDELHSQLANLRYDTQLAGMTNESRRAEWLAVRLLVKNLFGPDVEVAYHPTGRPYLKGSDLHISISHTRGYASVAYHRTRPIGMDIEHLSSRVERIAPRFTTAEEASYIDAHDADKRTMYHLINWSAKEALYKLHDTPSMAEFKEAFDIAPYPLAERGILTATIHRGESSEVPVHYIVTPEFVCTWAMLLG